jgi:predicted nucleotidyltransferase
MPTIQEIDAAIADRLRAARDPLIAALSEAARGQRWHCLLFGSMARGTPRRGSDADIAIVGAGADWVAAERAAHAACRGLGLTGDVMMWEDLAAPVRASAEREGIRCG